MGPAAAAPDTAAAAGLPCIEVHLPAKLSAELRLSAAQIGEIDPKLISRPLDPALHTLYDPALHAVTTPDRTPAGASAFPAAAALKAKEAAAAALAASTAGAQEALLEVSASPFEGAAVDPNEGTRCAVEVAAPVHEVRVALQDFFARFRALNI